MNSIDTQISDLEQQLKVLHKQKKLAEIEKTRTSPVHCLAIAMHTIMCHANHIDDCGWHYEVKDSVYHDWAGAAHSGWLMRANRISKFCDSNKMSIKQAEEFIHALHNYR